MFELHINNAHRDNVDILSDALEELGALSITFTDQYDDPILEPAPGAAPLWPHVVIHALFSTISETQAAHLSLLASYPDLNYTVHELPEQDWERTCLDQFQPQQFGTRLWVCPSWLTPPDANAVNLILDPGLAFGTGNHATTSLCLTWLEQSDVATKNIIDYGCGSGILALAAIKLGARVAYAVDIDEQALLATKNNAESNNITSTQLIIGTPEILNAHVDVIIANILLAPLLTLKNSFYEKLCENGTLVVSGILATQTTELIDAYSLKFTHVKSFIQNEWALIVFIKRSSASLI